MPPPSFRPQARRDLLRIGLRIAAGAVLASGVALWIVVGARELRAAWRSNGRTFTDVDLRQFAAVRDAVPEGVPILLLTGSANAWEARLWQRWFFPRNPVLVVYEPWDAGIRTLRRRYDFQHAVVFGAPPFDPGFRWSRDLGEIPGLPGHAIFGELGP